jgi:hypothetical protein
MPTEASVEMRHALRQILRRARFEGWNLDDLEDEIDHLFREGVPIHTPPPADQQLGPP